MESNPSTPFESFNARALNPAQVASSFVPSESFEKLCRRRHTIVVGPRGSGKTTLLKMLQPAALESWSHLKADEFCEQVDFTGIFIPFDISWQAQLKAIANGSIGVSPAQMLGTAAFTTHVLRAVIGAFMSRTSSTQTVRRFRRVSISPAANSELSKGLYESWLLPEGPKSLFALRSALGQRLVRIGQIGNQLRFSRQDPEEVLKSYETELTIPFLSGVSAAIDEWERVTETSGERWGLLFDELELAPRETKSELFQSMRSRDDRLLFKLAISPSDDDLPTGSSSLDPQSGQDYDKVALWFSEKRDGVPFCRALWEAMLHQKGLPPTPPEIAFGASSFASNQHEWRVTESGTAYAEDSQRAREFEQLSRIDRTFRLYLEARGLDPLRLDKVPTGSRPAELRKISPLVTARLFFLRQADEGARASQRSRKRLTLYAGWETVCAISEGNPRWFIGMVSELIANMPSGRVRFSPSRQAQEIESAASRYRAALKTIPPKHDRPRHHFDRLLNVVERVGTFFHEAQIEGPFAPEPPGSLLVDQQLQPDMLDIVSQALNTGAFVFADENEGSVARDQLVGRRLRLCYLLAAYYGAMPRLSRQVSLSRLLRSAKATELDDPQFALE